MVGMDEAEQALYLVASDAAALGGVAAYGGVIQHPDGSCYEVYGIIPRTSLQEVTAALTVLQHMSAEAEAVLQVDAQADELRSVLVVTHPKITITRIPRNSSALHNRAHDLARAALRGAPYVSSGEHQRQRVALYTVSGVKTQPLWAAAYELSSQIYTQHGRVPRQGTKALTLQLLHDAVRAAVPASHLLLRASEANPTHPSCSGESTRTLRLLRSEAARVMASIQP